MMRNLKYLKDKIHIWNRSCKEKMNNQKRSLKAELAEFDLIIDKGEAEADVVNRRNEVVRLLQDVEKIQSLEVAQKAKIKWAIEGMRTLSIFMVFLKKREVIIIFMPHVNRLHIDMNFLNKIKVADLECEVSKEGIKRAVWDCGIDKSPGPDGFTFGFYRRYWNIIENDVDAVTCFFHQGCFPKGGNSSFVTLIPKTLNADMVKDFRSISLIGSMYKIIAKILVNRLVVVLGDLVNEKKKQSLVFKVDFEKAYDSVRRDYLDDVLSPMEEFQFYKGLKQGLFKGIVLAPSLHLSYMFYSDDAIFMGQWSESNIDTIVQVLECFHRASGIRINMSKSKILGISVEVDKVEQAAVKIGCTILKTLFSYLGSKVGGGMSRIHSWKATIEGMVMRLSKWKLKTLSIGGRLTLLKLVRMKALLEHQGLAAALEELPTATIMAYDNVIQKKAYGVLILCLGDQVRMKALLEHQGLAAALEELPTATIMAYDNVIQKKAYGALILCLGDQVLWEITKETTATGIWKKLKTLYMTKYLANFLYLKKKLYTFHMHLSKSQSEHIDEFHKLIGNLAAIDTAISDEDQTLLLLTSLPSSYDNFMETLQYGRDSLKLEDRDMEQGMYSMWSKSYERSSRLKCYICQSEEHLKRDYPRYNHKKSQGFIRNKDQVSSSRADVTMLML
nr:RNA-directed DNA polymerase, eukaryota, reverse transcriptase zinc-binding domain protein [Tanacetum cinerariifolium]